MRNRDLLQNWMRKDAGLDFNINYPEEVKKTLEDLPGYMKGVERSANDVTRSLEEVAGSGNRLAETGDKLAGTGDRAIVLGDRVVDRYDKAVEYLPWLGTGLFGGGLLGALLGGKHKLLGSVIGATGGATAGGIAKYLYDQYGISKQAAETSNAKLKAGDEGNAGLISYLPSVFLYNKVKQLFNGNKNSKPVYKPRNAQSAENWKKYQDNIRRIKEEEARATSPFAIVSDAVKTTYNNIRAPKGDDKKQNKPEPPVEKNDFAAYAPWLFGGGVLGAGLGGVIGDEYNNTLLGALLGGVGGAGIAAGIKYLNDDNVHKKASADECDRRARLHYKLHSR